MTDFISIREVGPRDGLQMVSTILTTEQKLEWCRRTMNAGIDQIEVTSFVPPKIAPQFADAEKVALGSLNIKGLKGAVLVPNLRGADRALQLGVYKVHYTLSASETHNMKNVRRSSAESLADFDLIMKRRAELPNSTSRICSGISTAFGCAMEGDVPESKVLAIVGRLLELGVEELVIADTVGYANPAQVRSLMRSVLREAGHVPVAVHFHDTRGLALANMVAAAEVGVRAFDASLAGLGGCPFAPNATGNVNTEDTVYMFEAMGFETGVNVTALLELRETVESWLPGEHFSGAIAVAGLPKTYRGQVAQPY